MFEPVVSGEHHWLFLFEMSDSYLILIKVGNDHSNEQSESNHASQKHKDMNIDAMYLWPQEFSLRKVNKNIFFNFFKKN